MTALGAACFLSLTAPLPAGAQGLGLTAYKQAVAETLDDDSIASFYRGRDFAPLWTGPDAASTARRAALIEALQKAPLHGLPARRYDVPGLMRAMQRVEGERARGELEVRLSRAFIDFANDLQSGALEPRRVDSGIKREAPRRDSETLLRMLAGGDARAAMQQLAPRTPEYARLMRAKLMLERDVARGGWGEPIRTGAIEPGESGDAVVRLRDRLIAMHYLKPTLSASYDEPMQDAVATFQEDHGLKVDGVAGSSTLSAINVSARDRLKSVIVAMERERWMNLPDGLGKRHIKVNLTDFHAQIIDDGKVTFRTRSVVGHQDPDRRTPEFSDEMDHMVINPSWYVPRSIVVNEYLPLLRRNPGAVSHLLITDSQGRRVNRARGFSQYSASSFPFSMRQPPGPKNALGQVKFMFPNKYNIYLHDTPSKHLFDRQQRTYSHGCVRLSDPKDFAYALLARQTDDPQGFFQSRLRTGSESRVNLDKPVPVHLIYRTAYTTPKGQVQFRDDIYGRDARIWNALEAAGVALLPVQS
ncbi:L,D-transpeptidase YcbB [Salipiger mucosus DSM 16094]|uniref:L,D-transpeptidase YcbB n=2 Tax=Salipiger mucosus TaxID=263378 RepID=S9QFL9_9RHOB|nr:L,D-transpeptidase YcbB [Salipiger mucosus DSM 16094]